MNTFAKSYLTGSRAFPLWSFCRRAGLAIGVLAANLLYASFARATNTLHHIDPIIFTALQMAVLLPGALLCCYHFRRRVTKQLLRQGAIAGLLLGLGFIGEALSLRNIGIVRAAMLTGLDGIMASLIAYYALRQRQHATTWFAAAWALDGAFLLWFLSPGAWQADLLAVLVGLLFCLYALYVERIGLPRTAGQLGPFFGVVFATMATVTLVLALCFGNWTTLQAFSRIDLSILAYTSCCTVLIPIVLNTFLQQQITAVGLSFAAVLEPLASLGFAYQQHTLHLAFSGWIGIACILLSFLIVAIGSLPRERSKQ
jgi:drug/metabolite transporter (DMT)-like permease